MDEYSKNEELHLLPLFYGYLLTIAIAGFGLFLVSVEPNILNQFRFWISPQTLNNLQLIWFALSVVTALLVFFIGVLIQLFKRGERLNYFIWFHIILSSSLLFSTIFYQLWHSHNEPAVFALLGILIITNVITFVVSAVFFHIQFIRRHNFLPFVMGIMAATTAFNWFYLSLIGRISIF